MDNQVSNFTLGFQLLFYVHAWKLFTSQNLWDNQDAYWMLRLLFWPWKGKHSETLGHNSNVLGWFTEIIN